MLFVIVVFLNDFYGDPIDCFVIGLDNKKFAETNMLDTYCWIHTTYTLPNNHGNVRNEHKPLPGLGTIKVDDVIKYHNYYQVMISKLCHRVALF